MQDFEFSDHQRASRRFRFALAAVLATLAVIATACGDDSSNTSEPATSTTIAQEASPSGAGTCQTADLNISATDENANSNERTITFRLENKSDGECTIEGSPTIEVFNEDEQIIDESTLDASISPERVTLSSNDSAYFDARYIPEADGDMCEPATRVVVTPPGNDQDLRLPLTNIEIEAICPSGGLSVTPVRANS
jgi:hypothetical protein